MDDDDFMVECEHCGRTVPFSQTSENMCDICPDTPIVLGGSESLYEGHLTRWQRFRLRLGFKVTVVSEHEL